MTEPDVTHRKRAATAARFSCRALQRTGTLIERGRGRAASLIDWLERHPYLLPILVVLVGAFFRFYNLNWDNGHNLHPDEREIYIVLTGVGTNPPLGWPSSIAQFFSTNPSTGSPLDPHFFAYGSLPFYLLGFVAGLISTIGQHVGAVSAWASVDTYGSLPLLGRGLSALLDVCSVGLVFLLGRRVYGYWTGVLAMALAAFTVLDIQLAHYFTVDTVLLPLALCTLLASAYIARGAGRSAYIWGGVALGAALATKTTALLLVVPLGTAAVLAALTSSPWPRTGSLPARLRRHYDRTGGELNANLLLLLTCFVVGALTFVVFEPYAVIDRKQLLSDITTQSNILVTNTPPFSVPFTIQYAHTVPYLYQLKNIFFWSMGIPLAAAAFAGVLWTVWRLLRGVIRPDQLVLLSWVLAYFLFVGHFFAKFNRYMLPILPVIALFGAALLVHWIGHARRSGKALAVATVVAVTGLSLLYSVAYLNIYQHPNTRVAASRWIFAHVPAGSTIAVENPWDDPLPLDENGHIGGTLYHFMNLSMYDGEFAQQDTAAKLDMLIGVLTHARYIVISSQRMTNSIPRLPDQYPISTRWYQLLFSNRLNFRLVKQFQEHPQLGPIVVHDYPADESFHVYDHPNVRILERIGPIAPARARQLLTSGLPSFRGADPTTLAWILRPSSPRPDARLMLSASQWRQDQQGPTFDQMFPPNGFATRHPLLVWLLALEVLGLLAFPLSSILFASLLDGGFAIAKLFGLLLVGWGVWILVSLGAATYTRSLIFLVVTVLALLAATLAYVRRAAILSVIRGRWPYLLAGETVFLAGFAVFALLRMWYPDLGHQFSPVTSANVGAGRMGEKQMELAFVNAIARSRVFPPLDPFFAHGYINYYYYGFYLVSMLCKLTQVAPATGFNLAIATFGALLLAGVFTVALTLTRRVGAGLLASLLVGLIGNLSGGWQVIQELMSVGTLHSSLPFFGGVADAASGLRAVILDHQALPPFDFWAPTRIVPPVGVDISEFPYFTYLFADLHPHLMAYPMTAAALAVGVSLLRGGYATMPARLIAVLLTGLLMGAIAVTNPWDFPTYLAVVGLGALIGAYLVVRRLRPAMLGRAALWAGSAAALSLLLYLPFKASYQTVFASGLGLVRDITSQSLQTPDICPDRSSYCPDLAHDILVTPLNVYLQQFGLFLFVLVSYLALRAVGGPGGARRWITRLEFGLYYLDRPRRLWRAARAARLMRTSRPAGLDWSLAAGVAILLLGLGFLQFDLLAFLVAAACLLGIVVARHHLRLRAAELYALGLAGLAVLLSAATQIVFVKDWLAGGDAFRMNTIFKFWDQVWVLLAVAAATLLYFFMDGIVRQRRVRIPASEIRPSRRRRAREALSDSGVLRSLPAPGAKLTPHTLWQRPLALLPAPLRLTGPDSTGDLRDGRVATTATDPTTGRALAVRVAPWGRPLHLIRRHPVWSAALGLLLAGSLTYTYAGTISRETYRAAWLPERSVPFTLDGMAFMKVAYPGDYAAIQWLNAHVAGAQVIAEAGPSYYDWRSRVSMFTGLPTIINGIHEGEQRYDDELNPADLCAGVRNPDACAARTDSRAGDLNTLYDSSSIGAARQIIRRYGVRYIYVGFSERQCVQGVQCYSRAGLAKFDRMVGHGLRVVYNRLNTTIYQVTL